MLYKTTVGNTIGHNTLSNHIFNPHQMMLPVSRYVSPDEASSSFYKKHCVAAEVIYLAIFCCLATIKVALWQLKSTYVEVCLLVYEKHKSGTEFVLLSHCH